MHYQIAKVLRSGHIRTLSEDHAKVAAEILRHEGNAPELVGATLALHDTRGTRTFTIGLSDDGESLTAEEDHP